MTGRPRNFDEVAVLDSAMATFWEKGYDATSYSDLVTATGLGRQSLYQAFGDKRSLFTLTLEHYGKFVTQDSIEILESVGSPSQNIRRWLNRLRARAGQERIGCLLTNTAVELVPHDSDLAKLVQNQLGRVETALSSTIERAVAVGELPELTDASAMGTYFFGIAQGLMVMGRLGLSQAKLRRFTDAAMTVLDSASE